MPERACHQSESWLNEFPALAKLRLTTADFATLKNQGVVSPESRRGKLVFKLRFRCGRRQHVRYIGSDLPSAQLVEAELATLQRPRRLQRHLTALAGAAQRKLRENKQQLTPVLHARGYHFHGQTIRKRRCAKRPA